MNTSEHRTLLMSGVGIVAAACLVVALVSGGSNTSTSPNDSTSTSSSSLVDIEPVTSVPDTDSSTVPGTDPGDITGEEPTSDEPCVMTVRSLAGGDTGPSVTCLQEALIVAGFLNTAATGVYDNATAVAVEKLQTDRDLFVDGKTGRETALSLGVWPDENSLVIRTPPPTPGAVDLWATSCLPWPQVDLMHLPFHRIQDQDVGWYTNVRVNASGPWAKTMW